MPTGWPPDGLRVASGWPRGGRNPPGSCFASVDTQPARGIRGWQAIDPGFRLPPTDLCGHFPRKAPLLLGLIAAFTMPRQYSSSVFRPPHFCFQLSAFQLFSFSLPPSAFRLPLSAFQRVSFSAFPFCLPSSAFLLSAFSISAFSVSAFPSPPPLSNFSISAFQRFSFSLPSSVFPFQLFSFSAFQLFSSVPRISAFSVSAFQFFSFSLPPSARPPPPFSVSAFQLFSFSHPPTPIPSPDIPTTQSSREGKALRLETGSAWEKAKTRAARREPHKL